MRTPRAFVFAVLLVPAGLVAAVQTEAPIVRYTPWGDAKLVIDALREDLLPELLRPTAPVSLQSLWPDWISARDRAIRERLARGDEDTVVNFLLFGTTFTDAPRPSPSDVARLAQDPGELPDMIAARVDDFMLGVATPGQNERLRFARSVVERNGLDPDTADGQGQVRRFLVDGVRRGPTETIDISRALDAAVQRNDPDAMVIDRTAFRDRGLSSDTSILIGYAIEQVLQTLKANRLFTADGARRVGLVGPGLDFTDKDAGYDLYPLQTIQPFALIDSLIGLGLTTSERIQLTTFDLNPRINRHLETARERASAGDSYQLAFPRNIDLPWNEPLVAYWTQLGSQIGDPDDDVATPPNAGNVRVRAVNVRPEVVLSVVPRDMNVVLQRLEPLQSDERFDLIVATDILVYYDVFEQSLALANVAAMLRPGGVFITNNAVFLLPGVPLTEVDRAYVSYMPVPGLGEVHDQLISYRRE